VLLLSPLLFCCCSAAVAALPTVRTALTAAAAAAPTLVAYLCLVRHVVADLLGNGVALILAGLLALHIHVHITTLACKQQQIYNM
jgi:hypothetical protein